MAVSLGKPSDGVWTPREYASKSCYQKGAHDGWRRVVITVHEEWPDGSCPCGKLKALR